MKGYDREYLKRKIEEKNKIIREQHKLPKKQRDEKAIASAKDTANRMTSWLNDSPEEKPQEVKPTMTKDEFKKQFNETFSLAEADSVIKLETLDEVREAWPHIKGRHISVDGPPEVKAEIMRLYRKEFGKVSVPGFRPKSL